MTRPRIIVYIFIFAVVLNVCSGCAAPTTQVRQADYYPADDWRTSTPEEQGLDSSLILVMLQEIQKKNLGIHSVLIVRHGYLVTEVYYPPYQQDIKHPVHSITKSITSAMVGKAIQEGYIKTIQQKVLDYFPDIAREVNDRYIRDLTIEHLLTMSAGYGTSTIPNLEGKDASFDTVREILTYNSVLWPPSTSFFYDSGMPHVLSAIVQKTTGMTLQAYAEKKLFGPMGITDIAWDADPRGITTGHTGLKLRPMDMAKIGYLYLHLGEWNGAQLLSEDWINTSTTKHVETKGLMNAAEDDGYGYLWWIDSFGGYSAHGFGGQYIFVLPSLDMVIVFTGGLPDAQFPMPNRLVKSYLLPAAQPVGSLAPNPQALQSLQNYIQAIQQGDPSAVSLPKIAQEISGKTFRTSQEPHVGWWDAVTLTFDGGGTYKNVSEWSGNQFVLTGSLNQVFYINPARFPGPPAQDLLLPLRGHWQEDGTFVEQYMQNLNADDIDLVTQKYTFAGDQVTIEVSSGMGLFSGRIIGELVK